MLSLNILPILEKSSRVSIPGLRLCNRGRSLVSLKRRGKCRSSSKTITLNLVSADQAVGILLDQGIVALPTETVYGLAGLALDPSVIKLIYRFKGRPSRNPLIVHVKDLEQAESLAKFNPLARKACEVFWPGPLSLILPKRSCVPSEVTAGGNTVALRMPRHELFLKVLTQINQPLAAPSANPSNRTSPTTAAHLVDLFGLNCPPTVDGGKCSVGLESTVLDLTQTNPIVLRPGFLSVEDLSEGLNTKVLAQCSRISRMRNFSSIPMRSPGTNELHYAPKAPLYLHESTEDLKSSSYFHKDDPVVVCSISEFDELKEFTEICLITSNEGNVDEIGSNLYARMHEADSLNSNAIHVIYPGNASHAHAAILDRLQRAARK